MLTLDNTAIIHKQTVRWGKEGNGPPLVAMHGTPFSCQAWRKIIPYLKDHWTIYFYDMPGYGQSEMKEDQNVSLGMQNQIFAELLEHWGIVYPHILAHDFGGATALRGYYLNKLRYASLTLIDPVALAPWGSPLIQHVRQHIDAFTEMPEYMHNAILDAYISAATFSPMSPESREIYTRPWVGSIGQAAFYRQIVQMDQSHTDDIEAQYGPMNCPVTILWGEEDQWIPINVGEKLAKLISASQFIRIPNCGHLVQEDCPEAIVAAMLNQKH